MNFFGSVRYDWDEESFLYADIELDFEHIKKCLLAACGGNFTETYFRMFNEFSTLKLFEHLKLYSDYQDEQEKYMKERQKT
ncbi:hypothetical protein [Nostoc phage N1]|nr:hypothetical protein [Nostoc phage N1]